jgi:hypothetical protein
MVEVAAEIPKKRRNIVLPIYNTVVQQWRGNRLGDGKANEIKNWTLL